MSQPLNTSLKCEIVTPEAAVLSTKAEFIALPLYDGELGVLPRHSPMIGRLGFGELRITTDERVLRYYVDGGFVQVVNNSVSVLTNRALPVEKVDGAAAAEQLAAAIKMPASGAEAMAIRERRIAQARGQLRIARGR
ncbi:MAG: ATP synthase F1 subunit epsilon [Pirellulaceae bacterium]